MQNQQTKNQCYTRFIDKHNVILQIENASLNVLDSFSGSLHLDKSLLPINVTDGYEFINFIAQRNQWPDYIRKIYLQCYIASEQRAAGSGCFAAYFLAKRFMRVKLKDPKAYSSFVKYSDYEQAMASIFSTIDRNLSVVIRKIIELSGINGNVAINSSMSSIPAIEMGAGHKFHVGIDFSFLSNSEKRDEVKLILFDGAVTEVGQIDRIFTACNEKKISCVIIARSFANDVISTINVNQQRNTLDILPVTVNDSIENINVINDIAICTGAPLITAESGIRLSNIDIEDMVTINDVILTKRNIDFASKHDRCNIVADRIEKVKRRIESAVFDDEMSYEDIDRVFLPRLSSLSSNSVNVWIPGEREFLLHVRKSFDFSIKLMSAFSNSGMVRSTDIFLNDCKLPELLPGAFVDSSLVVSKDIYTAISNSGGCVAIL